MVAQIEAVTLTQCHTVDILMHRAQPAGRNQTLHILIGKGAAKYRGQF